MSTDSPDLFAALEQERQELRRRLEALDRAEDDIRQALGGANSQEPTTASRSRAGVQQRAAQHHMDAIVDYLSSQRRAFQADIGKALSLNSGTVSLALRQLADDGVVQDTGQRRSRSPEWEFIQSPRERERVATR